MSRITVTEYSFSRVFRRLKDAIKREFEIAYPDYSLGGGKKYNDIVVEDEWGQHFIRIHDKDERTVIDTEMANKKMEDIAVDKFGSQDSFDVGGGGTDNGDDDRRRRDEERRRRRGRRGSVDDENHYKKQEESGSGGEYSSDRGFETDDPTEKGGIVAAPHMDGSFDYLPPFTKERARYVESNPNVPLNCKDCAHFVNNPTNRGDNGCLMVQGSINAEGHCDEFYSDFGIFAESNDPPLLGLDMVKVRLWGEDFDMDGVELDSFLEAVEQDLRDKSDF